MDFFPISINRTALNNHTGEIIFQIQLSVQANLNVHGFFPTLRYRIDEQDLISEQGGKFPKINKRAGLNKQAGWKIGKNLIKEQD